MYCPITSRRDFERVVQVGATPESKYLEFKSTYDWQGPLKKPGQDVEVCRDISQFLNTDGGVLIVGVSESTAPDGRLVAGPVRPIERADGLVGWIEQAVRNYLTPSTFARSLLQIDTCDGPILVVNIPASIPTIALWHKKPQAGIEYLYRTEHGKQWMNPDEVERHRMNGSRAARLALAEAVAELQKYAGGVQQNPQVELVPGILERIMDWGALGWAGEGNPPSLDSVVVTKRLYVVLTGQRDRTLSLTVYDRDQVLNCGVEVPYEFVQTAWVTSDRKLGLRLDVQLFAHDEEQRLRISMHPLQSSFIKPAI